MQKEKRDKNLETQWKEEVVQEPCCFILWTMILLNKLFDISALIIFCKINEDHDHCTITGSSNFQATLSNFSAMRFGFSCSIPQIYLLRGICLLLPVSNKPIPVETKQILFSESFLISNSKFLFTILVFEFWKFTSWFSSQFCICLFFTF